MTSGCTARMTAALAALLMVAGCGGGSSGGYDAPPAAAASDLVVRTAALSGAQEETPVATDAVGKGAVVVDAVTREIRGGFTFSGLSGNATAAHIHKGAAGVAGGVEIGLTLVTDGGGVPIGAIVPPGTTLTQTQYDSLLAGELYFNVHTAANTGGEIRGQITGQGGNVAAVATVNGAQEYPAVSSAATGAAVLVVDTGSREILVAAETFSGMTPTASHIHQGASGTNGGVIVALTVSGSGPYVAMAPHSAAPLSSAQYAALGTGGLYFNVHSAAYTGGEIRGQLAVGTQSSVTAATTLVRTATLAGDQEVPPVVTTGAGKGAVVVDTATRQIRGGITFENLSGNATAAHIHKGAAGVAGGVEIGLTLVTDGGGVPIAAIVPAGTTLTQAQYDSLLAGELYFNVHTAANSGGEIRGQITGQGGTVAASATLTGAQEVPPVATGATGSAVLVVDSSTKSIVIAAETFSGVTATATHIHRAAAGVSGGVAVGLLFGTGEASAPHAAVLTDAQYGVLSAGELYFNVHSAGYPGGEIRGQLTVLPQVP